MNITIKRIETEDEIRGKAFVHWKAWHEAYTGLISQEYLDRLTLEVCEKMAFGRTDNIFVAKDGDRVVGFAVYGDRGEENPETGEIIAIYVLAEYYGKGVGRQLMKAGMEQLKAYPKICLWVLKDNGRSIRFYEESVFRPDGEELFHPRLGASEIRMVFEGNGMRIETERLVITDFTMDMAGDVHRNSLDEDNRRFVPDEVFETEEDAREAIGFLMSQYGRPDGPQVHPVLLKDSRENIGYVQMAPLDGGDWEIGYHIAKRYTGNGYATEAVQAFLPVMAEKMGIREVSGVCLMENAASRHVLLKCGFEPVFEGNGDYQGEKREVFRSIRKMPDHGIKE